MENFQVYRDIQARTGGDIYIGVVGPVRTGKSTFIRRFMELVALPAISEGKKAELQDELPLSGPRPSAPGYHGKPESFPYKKASLHILACKFREPS